RVSCPRLHGSQVLVPERLPEVRIPGNPQLLECQLVPALRAPDEEPHPPIPGIPPTVMMIPDDRIPPEAPPAPGTADLFRGEVFPHPSGYIRQMTVREVDVVEPPHVRTPPFPAPGAGRNTIPSGPASLPCPGRPQD